MRAPPTHDTHIARHTYSPPYQGFLVVFSHQPPAPAPGAAPPTSTPCRRGAGERAVPMPCCDRQPRQSTTRPLRVRRPVTGRASEPLSMQNAHVAHVVRALSAHVDVS